MSECKHKNLVDLHGEKLCFDCRQWAGDIIQEQTAHIEALEKQVAELKAQSPKGE